jgi:hypothetical protein
VAISGSWHTATSISSSCSTWKTSSFFIGVVCDERPDLASWLSVASGGVSLNGDTPRPPESAQNTEWRSLRATCVLSRPSLVKNILSVLKDSLIFARSRRDDCQPKNFRSRERMVVFSGETVCPAEPAGLKCLKHHSDPTPHME